MKSSPAMKIRAPYRHDLARPAHVVRLGGHGNTRAENGRKIEEIGKQILDELLAGKECRFCDKEYEGEGENE